MPKSGDDSDTTDVTHARPGGIPFPVQLLPYFWLYVVVGVPFVILILLIADKSASHPTVDWVQLVAFFGAVVFLPYVRFALTSLDLMTEILMPEAAANDDE